MAEKAKRPKRQKPGRPSLYSEELVATICERIADGESLRAICRDDAMPPLRTVFDWLAAHETFSHQYARAREAQADTLADEIVAIADGKGDAQRDRLRMDARKWVASKLKPRAYGDKLDIEHSGSIQTMTDEALDARIAELLRKSGASGAARGDGEAEGAA